MLENFVSSLERLNPANLDDPTSNMEAIQDICLKGQLFIDFPFTNRVNDIKYIKKSGYHSMFYLSSRVSYLSLWLSCFYFLIIEAFSCFELKPSKSKILQMLWRNLIELMQWKKIFNLFIWIKPGCLFLDLLKLMLLDQIGYIELNTKRIALLCALRPNYKDIHTNTKGRLW